MKSNDKIVSEYIDKLNADMKPKEHAQKLSQELDELTETVRMIKSLKEPTLPDADFRRKLSKTVAGKLIGKDVTKHQESNTAKTAAKPKRNRWYLGVAAIAAIVVMVVALNFIIPIGRTNIVYAMEQAFKDVKAYHGIIEIVETNNLGNATTQARLEVWANKEGNYYLKELAGQNTGLITANNGKKKWQLRPEEKQAYLFSAFPDPYRFTFELGKEIDIASNAVKTKIVGEETISGRRTSIIEVTPQGGSPYRIWIDKETKLPLQKQSNMQNSVQYKVTYTKIDFIETIPTELIAYKLPDEFKEVDTNPEQLVSNMDEAVSIAGFAPKVLKIIPSGYASENIAVTTDSKIIKQSFITNDKKHRVEFLQSASTKNFKPANTAILGKIGESTAEVQSPIEGSFGVLAGGGTYVGANNISSIRWQQDGFEYAIVSNVSLDVLFSFVNNITGNAIVIPNSVNQPPMKPQTEVNVNLKEEEYEQKSVDGGHTPWKLDPAFVAQVFVSLKISPEGVDGDYPVSYEDFKPVINTGNEAVIEVSSDITPISKVHLKKLIRQDSTGIWTVVGFDTIGN